MEKQKTFTPNQVYQYFQKRYPILKQVKLRQITTKMGHNYQGATQLNPKGKQIQYKYVGKTRQWEVVPEFIMLNFTQEHSLFVLLHQITHCVIPKIQVKRGQDWVLDDHTRVFYQKFAQIIQEANQKGLYHKKFDNLQHLMKYDKSV